MKIKELDYIRGISCLLIILYHYTTRYTEIFNIDNFPIRISWGCGAVNNFFLLTAFLTVLRIDENTTLLHFVRKRTIRLYPSYWISILFTSLTTFILCPRLNKSIYIILMNLPMIHGFFKIDSVDGVYWTLFFELIFYFYICIIILIKYDKNVKLTFFSVFWTLISLFLIFFQTRVKNNILLRLFDLIFMPDMCAPFTIGISLYLIYILKKCVTPYFTIVCSLILSFLSQPKSYFINLLFTTFVVLSIIKVNKSKYKQMYDCFFYRISLLLKPIELISIISYPLYLLHQFIGYSIMYQLNNYGYTKEIIIMIPLFASLVMATICYYLSLLIRKYLNVFANVFSK